VTITAGVLTYPLDTIRKRLMMQVARSDEMVQYRGARDCFKKMVAQEGYRSLYKGLTLRLVTGSGGALMLVVWDKYKSLNNSFE
jgi:solute carrier family 25 (mitochondrial adenine nucleotide translocator), member 4/5/6/31